MYISHVYTFIWLILLTALSEAWVCRRWLVGIAGSNPVGDMVVSLL
jgi:hypothetical protein